MIFREYGQTIFLVPLTNERDTWAKKNPRLKARGLLIYKTKELVSGILNQIWVGQ